MLAVLLIPAAAVKTDAVGQELVPKSLGQGPGIIGVKGDALLLDILPDHSAQVQGDVRDIAAARIGIGEGGTFFQQQHGPVLVDVQPSRQEFFEIVGQHTALILDVQVILVLAPGLVDHRAHGQAPVDPVTPHHAPVSVRALPFHLEEVFGVFQACNVEREVAHEVFGCSGVFVEHGSLPIAFKHPLVSIIHQDHALFSAESEHPDEGASVGK